MKRKAKIINISKLNIYIIDLTVIKERFKVRKPKVTYQIKCCKEIKPVIPKGNQPWIFTGKADAKAENPILQPPDVKSRLIGKDPDAGKDWRQEKGMTEDNMVGWHHQLNGHEFEQAPRDGEGQGYLACCSPWGHRVRWTATMTKKKTHIIISMDVNRGSTW